MDKHTIINIKLLKISGGHWLYRGYDGQKYVCLDDIIHSDKPCIVYSFGISDDISFEKVMLKYGTVCIFQNISLTFVIQNVYVITRL